MSKEAESRAPGVGSVAGMPGTTRRVFLGGISGIGASVALGCSSEQKPKAGETKLPAGGTMPRRKLGRTGVEVGLLGLGGYHIGSAESQEESARIIHRAMDNGVTFMDNCWDYHKGKSEEWMGKALAGGRRQKVFLMTKTDGHTKEACAAQIDQSLRRLATDYIDLVQIHEVIRPTDPDKVFAPGGAVEALVEAKKAGKIRFLGFTGHKSPDIHLAMLKKADEMGFAFDTAQMPLNVFDHHFESFEKKVLPVLVQKNMGVLGMKPLAAGAILKTGVVNATQCLHYAMNLQTSVVITGCDSMGVLEQALAAAYSFKPLPEDQLASLLQSTAALAQGGKHERFKTSQDFDGTEQNPHWLTTSEV